MGSRRQARALDYEALCDCMEHHGADFEPMFFEIYEWVQQSVTAKEAIDFYMALTGILYEKPPRS